MLKFVTCTGARPEAFSNCKKFVHSFFLQEKVQWIIVDDGPEQTAFEKDCSTEKIEAIVVRPEEKWQLGQITLQRNLVEAFSLIDESDKVVFIEDDDWYHPGWAEMAFSALSNFDLFGEAPARYFNVHERSYAQLGNHSHACLRCSAITGKAISYFRDCLTVDTIYFDIYLWEFNGRKKLVDSKMTVGIKGMPGRAGATPSHNTIKRSQLDPDLAVLKSFIGEDYKIYAKYQNKQRSKMKKARPGFKLIRATVAMHHDGKHREVGEVYETSDQEASLRVSILKVAEYYEEETEKVDPNAEKKTTRQTKRTNRSPKKENRSMEGRGDEADMSKDESEKQTDSEE